MNAATVTHVQGVKCSVLVRALQAFAPAPGLVGIVFGRPPVAGESLADPSLSDIDAAVARVSVAALATGQPWCMAVSVSGRKPRGFDAAKSRWRMDSIPATGAQGVRV